jgi:lipopolysaccharide/colanic/teichoic acid biosynthesis glycosyltransferase/nucleoside-diphosphate-sugar epimerase
MRIAITGANGFVGSNLLPALEATGADVVPIARRDIASSAWRPSPLLDRDTDPEEWARAFAGVDVVIHAAARAHVMREDAEDPLDVFRRVNRDGAVAMARGAARAGVRRIVFLSTVKVLGETTSGRAPFRNDDPAAPVDPYAISKREAELALEEVARELGLELVVLRPPLVYGPGVGGNMAALQRLIRRGVWLPLGGASGNRRSMISTGNLCAAIQAATIAPAAAGSTLLVSDDEDISTRDLLCKLAAVDGRRARLIDVPEGLLRRLMLLTGREALWSRLFGDLRVDIAQTTNILGWRPHLTVEEGMAGMGGDKNVIGAPILQEKSGRGVIFRTADVLLVVAAAPIVVPVCLILLLLIRLDSAGNALFIQNRVGIGRKPFRLVKLRTMTIDTGDLPSHEVAVSKVTRIGRFLRRTKLDELPQLWNILKGEMTFVGPRPCLPSQQHLIDERMARGLFDVLPGVTGPAQVAGIDMATPVLMAEVEEEYFRRATSFSDVMLIVRTVFGAGSGDVVGRR